MKKTILWLLLCFTAATTFSQSIKISLLPTATGKGEGAYLPVVQAGETKKLKVDSVAQLAKNYADSINALALAKSKLRLDTANAYADSLQAVSSDYKSYVGLISQTGTAAPTVTVFKNTLGGTVVWTRNSAGNYTGTLAGAFTIGKTVVPTTNQNLPLVDRAMFSYSPDGDTITILVRKMSDGTFADWGQSQSAFIEVRVYK
jgi:hypothetical protein